MPDFICSGCGNSFDATPDPQGNITCSSCGQVMSAADTQKPLPGGTRIDGYVLLRHLGSGGSGSVYLAEQTAMERTVALKILNPDRVDKTSAERFLEEARKAAKFENPHVVAVIDSGHSEAGYYYIAMQFVDGETLETMLQHGRIFSEEETLEVGITVAEALQTIWNKYKMFHKDIKPGNIMLTRENQPMILDMGTAQERGESKLADGDIVGSPYYMSPEQARGEVLTWSTDLYSLGTTMYQMVTGKYPYDAPEVEDILRMHDSAPFPEPKDRSPDTPVSEKMTELLRCMMGKTPSARYGSWEDFVSDARKKLEDIREKTDPQRRRQAKADPDFAKPTLKPRKVPSTINFVLAGISVFVLLAALLGCYFLYMAGRQNSLNARRLLAPIRKQANELMENPDPDAVDEQIRKAEPYFERFGILPSLRSDLAECRKKTEDFRELIRQEEQGINTLEAQTAECLKSADEEVETAKQSTGPKAAGIARKHFDKARSLYYTMLKTVQDRTFVLKQNDSRKRMLVDRLKTARRTMQREQQEFDRRMRKNAQLKSAEPPKPKPAPARPETKPEPPVKPEAAPSAPEVKPDTPEPPKAPAPRPDRKKPPRKPEAGKPTGPPLGKPKPGRAVKPGKPAGDPEQQKYQAQLEEEKNRIRAELLRRPLPRNLNRGDLLWVLRFQPDKKLQHAGQNLRFNRWLTDMQQQSENADSFWQTILNSRKTFAGFKFTVDTARGPVRMNLKTILGDTVYLHKDRMTESRKFHELDPREWSAFLVFAAKKSGMMPKLNSLQLLEGRVFEPDPGSSPFIRQEMPEMRKILIRLLSGEKIPGTDGGLTPDQLRKYRQDAELSPYLMRTGRTNDRMNPSLQKGRP